MARSWTTAECAADIRARVFPAPRRGAPVCIGAELEWIPVNAASGLVVPPEDGLEGGTLPLLRAVARRAAWSECRTDKGAPAFRVANGGSITYEPGGQMEYSSPPCASVSMLLERMRCVGALLDEEAAAHGVRLLAIGMDPFNALEAVPLRVSAERYVRMMRHFERIGTAGPRMMRQTASLQVTVDGGEDPALLWRTLNAAAPAIVAICANSRRYAGVDTGHASYRSSTWRSLDSARTGLFAGGDAAGDYLDFALRAPAILLGDETVPAEPFRAWLERGAAGEAEWRAHLTTLFPEVRPRGTFEVRSADSVPAEWMALPLAILGGVANHAPTLRAAADLLGAPSPELLVQAGRRGLGEPRLLSLARDLAGLALEGCRELGAKFMAPHDLEAAEDLVARYTSRGLAPADVTDGGTMHRPAVRGASRLCGERVGDAGPKGA